MGHWPKIVREKPFVSVLAVAIASLVVWLVAALWGPIAVASLAVLALTCVALYARHSSVREAHARATAGTFSFADVVVRMRAKDRAQALLNAQRREEIVGAQ